MNILPENRNTMENTMKRSMDECKNKDTPCLLSEVNCNTCQQWEAKDIYIITEGRWFEMSKIARIKLLSSELSISEEDALEMYHDDPNKLPDYVKKSFRC